MGQALAQELSPNTVVSFFGDLGSGKTTLIKALTAQLTGMAPHDINSPTFTYLHIYEGTIPIFHFDLYRLKSSHEFLERGFDEYFHQDGICLIEWAERIDSILPSNGRRIEMKHLGENKRLICEKDPL